jgi:hypothetical protein
MRQGERRHRADQRQYLGFRLAPNRARNAGSADTRRRLAQTARVVPGERIKKEPLATDLEFDIQVVITLSNGATRGGGRGCALRGSLSPSPPPISPANSAHLECIS